MANIGIIYGAATATIRRIVVPDTDAELNLMTLAAGEAMLVVDSKNGTDILSARAAVEAATGITPGGGRCAVVDDQGSVVGFISACPVLDVVPGKTLVASDTAEIGWLWSAGSGFRSGNIYQAIYKLSVFGSSNSVDHINDNNPRTYDSQTRGKFNKDIANENVASAGFGANDANNNLPAANGALAYALSFYNPAYVLNIMSIQFSGLAVGDVSADPATVTSHYNNLVGIARKWKALGGGTKVIVFTTFGFGCPDAATVKNLNSVNDLILANTADFDAVLNCGAASPIFQPTMACPAVELSADCVHLTTAGHTLLRDPFIAAVNSVLP